MAPPGPPPHPPPPGPLDPGYPGLHLNLHHRRLVLALPLPRHQQHHGGGPLDPGHPGLHLHLHHRRLVLVLPLPRHLLPHLPVQQDEVAQRGQEGGCPMPRRRTARARQGIITCHYRYRRIQTKIAISSRKPCTCPRAGCRPAPARPCGAPWSAICQGRLSHTCWPEPQPYCRVGSHTAHSWNYHMANAPRCSATTHTGSRARPPSYSPLGIEKPSVDSRTYQSTRSSTSTTGRHRDGAYGHHLKLTPEMRQTSYSLGGTDTAPCGWKRSLFSWDCSVFACLFVSCLWRIGSRCGIHICDHSVLC